jgi:hypothetical protein
MSNLYKGPFIDASYQVSVHLTKTVSEEKNFKNQPIRNKNRLWWSCLLLDRDEMSSIYKGPPIDDTYQVLVHLAKRFQRRLFRNQPNRNTNCLWRQCLFMKGAIFTKDLPKILLTKIRFIWPNGFRGVSKILKISQSETRIVCSGHVCKQIGTKWARFTEDLT